MLALVTRDLVDALYRDFIFILQYSITIYQ